MRHKTWSKQANFWPFPKTGYLPEPLDVAPRAGRNRKCCPNIAPTDLKISNPLACILPSTARMVRSRNNLLRGCQAAGPHPDLDLPVSDPMAAQSVANI